MKWGPQPKPRCGRPECGKQSRQWGYCPNHAALLERNGTPYTREEVAGMHAANRHEQEMDAALAANPPVIVWQFDPIAKVQVAIYIQDPHAERESKPRKPKGLRPIDIEYLEDIS
jgi:hypothetical protein